jgi:hypothetical protein
MTDRPDIPKEAGEAVAVVRLGPKWKGLVRGKDTPARRQAEQEKKAKEEALLAEIRTELQAAAPALRKQGAEEERERLREAILQRTGGNLHRAIREVFSEAEAALDTPAPSEDDCDCHAAQHPAWTGCPIHGRSGPLAPPEDCETCGGAGDGRIGMFGEFIPWDARHPKGCCRAHPCPDCSPAPSEPEEGKDA